ncbi:LLM class flavin-dependent oxidoreductase, partial [Methylobacterium hispanicum]
AANGPLRYGLSAFVIARGSDAEAEAEHARLLALAQRDADLRADTRARTDAASVMFAKTDAAASRHVGTNGGTAAGLVGSYETVAERIRAFHAAGIELFMLQFQPFEAEMRRFAEQVIPRIR